jgi:transposase-like protein
MTSATEVRDVVAKALQGVSDDLIRARSLVHDGVASLGASFETFRSQLVLQQKELSGVVDMLRGEGRGDGFVERMNRIVNNFVEDLVVVSASSMRLMARVEEMRPEIEAIVLNIRKVESMARKTRFVALNATIHSARTGHAGRTFRVVADQVKALADDAGVVSAQVRGLVTQVSERLQQLREAMSALASHDMNAAVEGQQKVITLLATLDETNQRVASALADVSRAATETAAAFQLESQVNAALQDAVVRLGPLVKLWEEWVSQQPEALPPEVAALFDSVRPVLERATAVQQKSLEAGTVELF